MLVFKNVNVKLHINDIKISKLAYYLEYFKKLSV